MPTFDITATTWANTSHTITANTVEEAIQQALAETPDLCHHCSRGARSGSPGLDVGDELEVTGIHDQDGNSYPVEGTTVERLHAELAAAQARIKELEETSGVVNTVVGDIAPGAFHIQAGNVTGNIHF
ncbi:hypothetical protein KGD82_16655 [Nocardiopsis eucommiae]|uniref:Uncharacterized protein n=1 Tax=Nocardiopsis eucommiae TaxID=2831970 RepID=A0A975L799_9ACTN|nr:hypothetical protein KGD82_16655 [Nocardiopsis eucommiae]